MIIPVSGAKSQSLPICLPKTDTLPSLGRKNPKIHLEVLEKVMDYAMENGFSLLQLSYSPITGGHGNIEYLAHFKNDGKAKIDRSRLSAIVEESHNYFEK